MPRSVPCPAGGLRWNRLVRSVDRRRHRVAPATGNVSSTMRPSRRKTNRSAHDAKPRLVRDQHDRGAVPLRQRGDQLDDLVAAGGIERAGRFVGEQHTGAHRRPRARSRCAAAGRRRSRRGIDRAVRRDPTVPSEAIANFDAAMTTPPASSSGSITFSIAVSAGIRLRRWNTKPTSWRRNRPRPAASSPASSWPPTLIEPALGVSSAPARCNNVLLPQPLGPITATNSPASTASETPRNARTSVSTAAVALHDVVELEDRLHRAVPFRRGRGELHRGRASADRPRRAPTNASRTIAATTSVRCLGALLAAAPLQRDRAPCAVRSAPRPRARLPRRSPRTRP